MKNIVGKHTTFSKAWRDFEFEYATAALKEHLTTVPSPPPVVSVAAFSLISSSLRSTTVFISC